MKKTFHFVIARLSEASTWRGIILLISGMGAAIDNTLALQIISVGVSAAGLVGMVFPDTTAGE
jgi:hypothetical protein